MKAPVHILKIPSQFLIVIYYLYFLTKEKFIPAAEQRLRVKSLNKLGEKHIFSKAKINQILHRLNPTLRGAM